MVRPTAASSSITSTRPTAPAGLALICVLLLLSSDAETRCCDALTFKRSPLSRQPRVGVRTLGLGAARAHGEGADRSSFIILYDSQLRLQGASRRTRPAFSSACHVRNGAFDERGAAKR